MGIVARCTHIDLNEQVALKLLRADVAGDADAVERFLREAQNASKLKSEYVARVSDYGKLETGLPYMVMEFLEGQDLGQMLDQRGTVAMPWAVEMVLQTCEALAEAHSLGIVHRDVKPTNLFVTWRPDGTALVKVLDFGISKMASGVDMQLTQTQSLLGTPAYMSPEQMRSARQVDGRTDIWSLGTVLYELLEGHRPFEAESFSEMCVKVAVDPPAPMRNTPPALQTVVLRCLSKMPEQRYASMAELGRDLVPFAQDPHEANRLVERMARMLGRRSGGEWDMGSYPSNPMMPRFTPVAAVTAPVSSGIVQAAHTHRERSAPAASISSQLAYARKPRRRGVIIGGVAVLGLGIALAVALGGGDRERPQPATVSNGTAPVDMRATPPETDFAPLPQPRPVPPPPTTPPPPANPGSGAPPTDAGSGAPPADTGSAAPPADVTDKKKKPIRDKKTGKLQTQTKPPEAPPPPEVKPPPPTKPPPAVDPFGTPRPPKQ